MFRRSPGSLCPLAPVRREQENEGLRFQAGIVGRGIVRGRLGGHFEPEYMGRGPKDIHTHLIGDLLVVRLHGVWTAAEQQLVGSLAAEKGRDLLKQVRTQLIETARPVLETLVLDTTGEEVVLFTLAESPLFREKKKWQSVLGSESFSQLPG